MTSYILRKNKILRYVPLSDPRFSALTVARQKAGSWNRKAIFVVDRSQLDQAMLETGHEEGDMRAG